MKIAFLNQDIYGGGAERTTVSLTNSMCEIPDNKVILITGGQHEKEYQVNVKVQRECILCGNLCRDIKAVRRFLTLNNIDVAIGMSIYCNFLVCMANYHIKTKMIISERNAPAQDHISWKSKLLRFLVYRNADGYVFQTNQARAFYSKKIQEKGVVIHNPVKSELPFKSDVNKKEIVAVGRLRPQKNYAMLLAAMKMVCKSHPEYSLHIYGQGSELESLKKIARNLQIEQQVVFEGFHLNVHERIADSAIYVLSSDFEGMPNALMEAMAMGFPVISTDCPAGGPAELIENNISGILVPVGDSEKMAEAICKIIDDIDYAFVLQHGAIKIRETHDLSAIVQQWMRFFGEVA